MNSTRDENDKRQGDFRPQESESNMLDGSTVRCFPTVKRTFRQKQCNWRWRWKYFTRALQPILEQGENAKDDTSKVDDNSTNSTVDGHDESKLQSSEESEKDCLELNNGNAVDLNNENNVHDETESCKSKEDYSACIKLIEKFQEAVLDNAVRVIQAAFKRFRERRRFLKLRKAATVIQRSVRQWLRVKHSSERPDAGHLAIKGNCEQNVEMQRNGSASDGLVSEVAVDDVGCYSKDQQKELADENHDTAESDSLFDSEGVNEGDNNISPARAEEAAQFENYFESLDVSSLSGSTDNVRDTGVCIDQCDEVSPVIDPDSLSLADSGIDMGSETAVEATNTDECKFSSETPLLISSNALIEETTSQE